MNIKPFTLTIATLAVSPFAWGAQQESQQQVQQRFQQEDQNQTQEGFDFVRINATIENVMRGVVASDERFSVFSYRFDPERTNVAEDRYAVRMKIAGKAPWSKNGFYSTTDVVVDHDPEGRAMVINASIDAEIKTDTLAMLRHLAATSRRCPLSDEVQGVLRLVLAEDCKVHTRLAEVKSFAELYEIFEDHIASTNEALTAYANDVRRAIDGATTESLRHSLAQQRDLAENLIQSVQAAQLIWNDGGITVSVANFSLLGIAQHKNVRMQFQEGALRVQGSVTITGKSSLFMAAKPEFIAMLRDMEDGVDSSKRLIQMESRFWMRLIGNRLYAE